MSTARTEPSSARTDTLRQANRRVFWIAFWTGVGLMGALDATAFHHLLRWHNLYVHAGPEWRAISDGLLHVVTTALLFSGVVLLWQNRDLQVRAAGLALASGVWLGMGAFQLVDGTLSHKVLHLHPVREGSSPYPPLRRRLDRFRPSAHAVGSLLWRRVKQREKQMERA
jgi:uncharacterized membrane protein